MSIFTADGFVLPPDKLREQLCNGADPNEVYCPQHSDELVAKSAILEAAQDPALLPQLRILLSDRRLSRLTADHEGRTALHHAAMVDNAAAVNLLLGAGFSPFARDTYHNTALHYACLAATSQSLLLLLSCGSDPNAINCRGRTPLRECLMAQTGSDGSKELEDKVRLLLIMGADATLADERGMTALHAAAGGGYTSVVRLLLARGADAWARTNNGLRPVDIVNHHLTLPAPPKLRRDLLANLVVLSEFDRQRLASKVVNVQRADTQIRPAM
ncbi:ankyrin repeat domain-containing protein [Luteimonas sp. SDU101]|uniref:ankyrin repeat domain-containing protein n=1 Tax=Luteimonas sp. SDU101 TaxID=3422593 RepID=UPI003EB88330